MNIEWAHTTFTFLAIAGAALTFFSTLGSYYTGRIIEKRKDAQITTIESELAIVQPRRVSNIQRMKLKEKLSQMTKRKVIFISRILDNESHNYADQIAEVFRESGWDVDPINRTLLDDFPGFITARTSPDGNVQQDINALRDAFLYADFNFQHTNLRENSMSVQQQPNTFYILVGIK